MRLIRDSDNALTIVLAEGEVLYHAMRFLRSRRFGMRLVPPFPLRAPIGRLWHRAYLLNAVEGDQSDTERAVSLVGTAPLGRFETLELAAGQQAVVDLSHLAGFVALPTASRLRPIVRSWFKGLVQPACWLLGHPVPCVFSGPATLILYGQGLRWRSEGEARALGRDQLVLFGTEAEVEILPLEPTSATAHFINAITFRSRVVVGDRDRVLIQDFQQEESGGARFFKEFFVHILLLILLALLGLWPP